MDQIIVGIIAVGAALYLFWRIRSTLKKEDACSGCAGCGGSCCGVHTECGSTSATIIRDGNDKELQNGNR